MKPILLVLTDLDGVHFQSRRQSPADAELIPIALSESGDASAFMTAKQKLMLSWLFEQALVVPVTARPSQSLSRVLVPFHGHAICSFGGVILRPDATPDPGWLEQMSGAAAAYRDSLEGLAKTIEALLERSLPAASKTKVTQQTPVLVTLVSDLGMSLYLNLKSSQDNEKALDLVAQVVREQMPPGFRMHRNGNNLSLLPPFLGKEHAVHYYLANLAPPHQLVVGLGDSLSDLDFISLCDFAGTPTNSQAFARLLASRARPNAETQPT